MEESPRRELDKLHKMLPREENVTSAVRLCIWDSELHIRREWRWWGSAAWWWDEGMWYCVRTKNDEWSGTRLFTDWENRLNIHWLKRERWRERMNDWRINDGMSRERERGKDNRDKGTNKWVVKSQRMDECMKKRDHWQGGWKSVWWREIRVT